MDDIVIRLRETADAIRPIGFVSVAEEAEEAARVIEELRAVLRGIIDLGGTMGSLAYAQTVDSACRRALNSEENSNA